MKFLILLTGLLFSMAPFTFHISKAHGQLSAVKRLPIGGKVLSSGGASSSLITCTATYGPIFMLPYVPALSGPYFIRLGTNGTPRSKGHILGNYSVVPDFKTCFQSQSGVPVPAFEIKLYGVSR